MDHPRLWRTQLSLLSMPCTSVPLASVVSTVVPAVDGALRT